MESNRRDKETSAGLDRATRESAENNNCMKRSLGRFMALMITTVGALAAALVMLTLNSCTDDDDDGPDHDWYISGVWQNNGSPDETMTFYSDGSGYWTSGATGAYLDFDYYCYDDDIYFTMYPSGAPSYTLDCDIDFYGPNNMSIEWPPSSMYGPTTIYYTRVD